MEEVPRRTSLAPLAFPCFLLCLVLLRLETEGLLDYEGRAREIISIVRSNLRPVIFGADERFSENVFCESGGVSGFPEKGADLQGSPGNLRRSSGNFRVKFGKFQGTLTLLLSSTVRELSGKSPGNFQGLSGMIRANRFARFARIE